MKGLSILFISILFLHLNVVAQDSWVLQNSGTNVDLNSVDFLNDYMGYIAGADDIVKASWDGGESWFIYSGRSFPSYDHWYSICYVNEDDIYFCGVNEDPFNWNEWWWTFTTDGGFNWNRPSGTFVPNDSRWMNAYFLNDLVGWKVGYRDGDGYVYKTTTGVGSNWSSLTTVPNSLNSIMFVDENYGWMVGNDGTIYRSTDGGINWTPQTSGTTKGLTSVYFINLSIGFTVGYSDGQAIILKTTNGGQSWSSTLPSGIEVLLSVYFKDSNIGWACGSISSTPSDKGVILYTSDGGTNWIVQHIENHCTLLREIEFINETTGWVVGSHGVILKTKYGDYNPEFSPLPDMNYAKYGAGYTDDGNNIYAVCGGLDESPWKSSSVEKYNIASGNWTDFVTGLIPRRWCSAKYVPGQNKVYIFNGDTYNSTSYTDTVEIVDVVTGNVSYSATNPYPVEYGGSAVWNDKIYVFGGQNSGVFSNRLYEFDPVTNNWTRLPDMPEAKTTSGVIIDGVLYVMGGYSGSTSRRIDAYDIQSSTWTPLGNMPLGVSAHSMTKSGNYILLIGSYDDIKFLATYDTETSNFTQLNSNMIGRRHAGANVIGNHLYVFGGNQGSGVAPVLNSFEYTDFPVGVEEEHSNHPTQYALYQNYPNPFNPTTKINYQIPQLSFVSLKVYDVLGNEIAVLVNEEKPSGSYKVEWDATDIPSGVYFYQLRAGSFNETKKMILLR